jgi:hypothetical protein
LTRARHGCDGTEYLWELFRQYPNLSLPYEAHQHQLVD